MDVIIEEGDTFYAENGRYAYTITKVSNERVEFDVLLTLPDGSPDFLSINPKERTLTSSRYSFVGWVLTMKATRILAQPIDSKFVEIL